MEDRALNSIARYVQERAGLSFAGHKKRLLRQRLDERLLHLGLSDLCAYLEILYSSVSEESLLLEHLTTNETFFFRNPRQFDYLREKIIPALEAVRGREVMRSWGGNTPDTPAAIMKLRILCAGCATGEEPYSVGMALLESLRYPKAWDIEIHGGDLNKKCIRIAAKGYYEEERMRGLPEAYRQRYTQKVPGGFIIREEVKRLIRFSVLNLNDIINGGSFPGVPAGFAQFDIIFCRNVMIYFTLASQQRLVDLLYSHLVPGGYLFTGDAEPLHLYSHDFAAVPDSRCLIYQKTENDENAKAV